MPRRRLIQKVLGNLSGLRSSQLKALERTFRRRVPQDLLCTPELAKHLAWISRDIGRQLGVLIDRRGRVEQVFVGDAHRIYLPDIGRARGGGAVLRGLRHIHTVLDHGGLVEEDFADLQKLRLDLVAALAVDNAGEAKGFHYAYLDPSAVKRPYQDERLPDIFSLNVDAAALFTALEEELGRRRGARREGTSQIRAVLAGVYDSSEESEWRLSELRELCDTAGVMVVAEAIQLRRRVDSKYLLGRGKLEEVVLTCLDNDCELVVFDQNLSGAQARAIAAFSDLKVIDRTQLILDIFAQHAHSRDGKLQVELAQLKYNLPRLTDLDAGLSRLSGGIGGRGPGETKLEINRRRARDRIAKLEKEIEHLSKRRSLRRSRRQRSGMPMVAIIGYTNAGKSTLLNRLTQADVLVADKLFATLDTSSRRLRFPKEREAVLTDTVGFIRDLPPDLMKAFRATLEELDTADLLLHLVDVGDPMRPEKEESVNTLLKELQLDNLPMVLVYNKAEKLESFETNALRQKYDAVMVSAMTGMGLKDLVDRLGEALWRVEVISDESRWDTAAVLSDTSTPES